MSVPWTATGKESGEGVYHIRSGEGYRVAMAYSVDDTSRIVRAVNSHADLLAIAKRALNESARVRPDFAADIRTAIAAAEGETT